MIGLSPPITPRTVGFRDLGTQQAPDSAKLLPLSFVSFLQYDEEDYDGYDYKYDAADNGAPVVTMSRKKIKVDLGAGKMRHAPRGPQPLPPRELKDAPQPSPRLKTKTTDVPEILDETFHNYNFHFG